MSHLKKCFSGEIISAKVKENKLRQELLANEQLFDHLCHLRSKIPRHSNELFDYRIDWDSLEEVSLSEQRF